MSRGGGGPYMCFLGLAPAGRCHFLPHANNVFCRPKWAPLSPNSVDRPPLATTARSHRAELARTSTTHPTCECTPRCSCCLSSNPPSAQAQRHVTSALSCTSYTPSTASNSQALLSLSRFHFPPSARPIQAPLPGAERTSQYKG